MAKITIITARYVCKKTHVGNSHLIHSVTYILPSIYHVCTISIAVHVTRHMTCGFSAPNNPIHEQNKKENDDRLGRLLRFPLSSV